MADHPNKTTHQILLDALVAFVTEHPNPKVQRFRQTMLNWGRRGQMCPCPFTSTRYV